MRAKAQEGDFEGVARLVRNAEVLHPAIRHYLRARTRAAILNTLKPSANDFVELINEIAKEPVWWSELEEKAGDPVAFPRAVRNAIRKINELGRGKRHSHA